MLHQTIFMIWMLPTTIIEYKSALNLLITDTVLDEIDAVEARMILVEYDVWFDMWKDDTWELTSDGYVNNFDDYRSNQDSDVDTADGKFTASVEGVYQFNFQALSTNDGSSSADITYINFAKNGVTDGLSQVRDETYNINKGLFMTLMVDMVVGDTMRVTSTTKLESFSDTMKHIHFTGKLIQAY